MATNPSTGWREVLTLSSQRQRIGGSETDLAAAVGRGADLRVGTEFRHNEHIDTASSSPELIRETMLFPVTYLIEDRWAAGVCTMRQPVALPDGFGSRPSMSFFLYNQDGEQAVARPYLDGAAPAHRAAIGAVLPQQDPAMPKYHRHDNWDAGTNAPSHNFVYDFEMFRYHVREQWRQVLHSSADGKTVSGSVDELIEAFSAGLDVKVAVSGACDDLAAPEHPPLRHEIFVATIACYCYLEQKLFIAALQPVVRIRPRIPMRYASNAWDFGWLIVRSDGHVARTLYDPYTLQPQKSQTRCAARWFVNG